MKNLLLIIPCYNEENRFRQKEIGDFIHEYKFIDFCFVNDGSTDGTANYITKHFVNVNNCFLISFPNNLGKGNAIRQTLLQLKKKDYHLYGFIDADSEIPFSQVLNLIEEINKGNFLMAISCRNLMQELKFNRSRSILSLLMMKIANQIIGFKPGLPDTQCGNKIFRREVLDACFSETFLSQWLFDIEVFLRFKKKYPDARKLITIVPLVAVDRSHGKSNFKLFQNLKLVKQLMQIWLHYRT